MTLRVEGTGREPRYTERVLQPRIMAFKGLAHPANARKHGLLSVLSAALALRRNRKGLRMLEGCEGVANLAVW